MTAVQVNNKQWRKAFYGWRAKAKTILWKTICVLWEKKTDDTRLILYNLLTGMLYIFFKIRNICFEIQFTHSMNHLLMLVNSANGHLYGFVFVLSSGLRRSRLNWELCFRSQKIPSTLLSPTKKSLRRNQRSFRSKFLLAPFTFPLTFLFLSLIFFSLMMTSDLHASPHT